MSTPTGLSGGGRGGGRGGCCPSVPAGCYLRDGGCDGGSGEGVVGEVVRVCGGRSGEVVWREKW